MESGFPPQETLPATAEADGKEKAELEGEKTVVAPEQEMERLAISGEAGKEEERSLDGEERTMLDVISKYLSLVVTERESKKQSSLLKDEGIGQFLVLALMHESLRVMSGTMDVFEVLLSTRKNHSTLQRLPYFLPTLEKIVKNKAKYPDDVRRDAANMLRVLSEKDKQPLNDQSVSMKNAENVGKGTVPNKMSTLTRARAKQRGRENVFQLNPGFLQQDQNRMMIERCLIKVKGIISLTFDLSKNRCIVRGKHTVGPEVFGCAIANLGLEVSLVYKNEAQEEVVVPIQPDENKELSKENMPDYLPEDDYDSSTIGDNAVCKQKPHGEAEKGGSIFGSAMNFVRNSFYW